MNIYIYIFNYYYFFNFVCGVQCGLPLFFCSMLS